MTQSKETITMYAAQAQVVMDALERDGVSRVKLEYIDKKYGTEAWIWRTAYSFFNQYGPQYVPRPEGCESAIWLHGNPSNATATPGNWVMKLEVPRDELILFDMRVWDKILNLSYVAKDEKDEAAFEKKLASMGLSSSYQAFSTSFYPLVKQEVQASWKRLFSSAENCPVDYLQGAVWELKQDWIVQARKID